VYQAKLIDSKASKVQEAWIEPTLLNGWENYGSGFSNIAYFKDEFDFVHLRGLIKSGTAAAGTDLFVLPNGYRPLENKFYPITNVFVFKTITVKSDGVVELSVAVDNAWVSLEGISFKVGE
jgi:hypothetical protein